MESTRGTPKEIKSNKTFDKYSKLVVIISQLKVLFITCDLLCKPFTRFDIEDIV
jgi:hypothetical protein